MKIFWIINLCISASLMFSEAYAQESFTLSVKDKGTFKLDKNYPKEDGGIGLFNFHRMIAKPRTGDKINYFIFKPDKDVFRAMRSMSKKTLFSRLEPCPGGIDRSVSDRAQTIGGSIKSISDKNDLSAYIRNYNSLKSRNYIYVAIDTDLRKYVRERNDFGYEWVAQAVEKKELCLYIGVGRMGFGALGSRPINVSRLAKFTFSGR
ncbi:hypothetical protein [Mesorhizobium sp.]|uniref:hypothetical protein n=1 Tax=Mesorhizobium sp. TaxID=1871066 RepID=UPI000FEA86B3|nr:hypothetical protein [Mesorhizobium sp.]RWC38332.1 MAG: hypothetical protein EOS28_30270 [Mesorhizobium sp.]RWF04514.1 MAG: hypothetical protein EOS68_02610 [Mesorhizobium sp.]